MKYILRTLLISAFFINCCSYLGAQDDTASANGSVKYSDGEIYLLNWTPPATQDGPVLERLILKYSFGINDDKPLQRFNFTWSLADFIIIDGQFYNRARIPKELFDKVKIKNIKFKAKVYASGKRAADIIIEYPNILPKSGGKSGWYIIGGPDWGEQFVNTSDEDTKEIFRNGFELKDPTIYEIEFEGLEEIRAYLLEEEPKTNGKIEDRTSDESDKKKFKDTFIGRLVLDYESNKKGNYKGFPWYIGLHPEIKYTRFPIAVNSYSRTEMVNNDTTVLLSYDENVGGYCLTGVAQVWPFFGNYFGLGSFVSYTAGGLPNKYAHYQFDFGTSSHIGDKDIKLIFEYSLSFRKGYYKDNFQQILPWATTINNVNGVVDYSASKLALGTRIWLGDRTVHNIDVMLIIEQMKLGDETKWNTVWRLRAWKPKVFSVNFEISTRYPTVGEKKFSLKKDYKREGLYLSVNISKTFDFFARPTMLLRENKRKWK